MDRISVIGGTALKGRIPISGAKNSALPLMAACLLTSDEIILKNIPHLRDVTTMANLLSYHGVVISLQGHDPEGFAGQILSITANPIKTLIAPYELVRQMRASTLVLGPLLARFHEAEVSLPGGCAIGTRPVDLHIAALEKLGATITVENGFIKAKSQGRLKGNKIVFPKVSVGATENAVMAATLAEGETVIHGAAREPEIYDLCVFLNKMGANIQGHGTDTLTIQGVERLHGTEHSVLPDRIETGTYAIAAAITGGEIELIGANDTHLESFFDRLREAGVTIDSSGSTVKVSCPKGGIKATDITTSPYPGYPTDLQAQFMALMTLASGTSKIAETIFENRFMHVSELARMGADITIDHSIALVKGTPQLKGAEVMATDLRASVSLVLAALAAEGETIIHRVYHLDRGYERLGEKLRACGAQIKRIRE